MKLYRRDKYEMECALLDAAADEEGGATIDGVGERWQGYLFTPETEGENYFMTEGVKYRLFNHDEFLRDNSTVIWVPLEPTDLPWDYDD